MPLGRYILSACSPGYKGRWVIVNPNDVHLGWSGSRWVFFGGDTQISNFGSMEEAEAYALAAGFVGRMYAIAHQEQTKHCWPWSHEWTKWAEIEEGLITKEWAVVHAANTSDPKWQRSEIGRYERQRRECLRCGKSQLREVTT